MAVNPGALLDRELGPRYAGAAPGPVEIEDVLPPGGTRAQRRTRLAEILAGTSDKKTRGYRNARRQAERWIPARGRKAATPTLPSRLRLGRARAEETERVQSMRERGCEMKLRVLWYGSRRKPEWLPPGPGRWVHISEWHMRRVINLWADGDSEEAADELIREFLKAYGVPNPTDWLAEAEIEDMRLELVR